VRLECKNTRIRSNKVNFFHVSVFLTADNRSYITNQSSQNFHISPLFLYSAFQFPVYLSYNLSFLSLLGFNGLICYSFFSNQVQYHLETLTSIKFFCFFLNQGEKHSSLISGHNFSISRGDSLLYC